MTDKTRIILVLPGDVRDQIDGYKAEQERKVSMPLSRQKIIMKLIKIGLKEAEGYDRAFEIPGRAGTHH